MDTGVDYTHPDLAGAIWTNPGETGGGKETNGLDDDSNGKVDDWRGWDFIGQNTTATVLQPDNDPMDDVGHGTHVAGIVGAIGNNTIGGTGVCWNVKILPLRIIKRQGSGTYGTYSAAVAVAAMDYILTINSRRRKNEQGQFYPEDPNITVANHSWGGNGYSLSMLNVVNGNPQTSPIPLPTGITGTAKKDANEITLTAPPSELAKIKVGMNVLNTGIPTRVVEQRFALGCGCACPLFGQRTQRTLHPADEAGGEGNQVLVARTREQPGMAFYQRPWRSAQR